MTAVFTVNGYALNRATLRMNRRGVWTCGVTPAESPPLVAGSRVPVILGDLSLTGTLRPGGSFGGADTWNVIAGAGKWDTALPASDPYRDDSGVMLSTVLEDLRRDVGELGMVLDIPDRSLGYAWTRPAGLASDTLRALVGDAWYVAPDGITHIGDRPSLASAADSISVESYEVATAYAVARSSIDALSLFVPGRIIAADGLPAPLPISGIVAHVEPGSVRVSVFGEKGLAELLTAIVQALTAHTRFHRIVPYAVAEVSAARATVKPSDGGAADFPAERFIDQMPGVPGMVATLAAGARVGVEFIAGDPARPRITAYDPSVPPASLTMTTTGDAKIGGDNAVALAKASVCMANFNNLRFAVTALGGVVDPIEDVATTKAKGV